MENATTTTSQSRATAVMARLKCASMIQLRVILKQCTLCPKVSVNSSDDSH